MSAPQQTCCVFCSPGPPMYGSRCRREAGHDGEHEFGTAEEARCNFDASMRAILGEALKA
jgi:hypothetical protein